MNSILNHFCTEMDLPFCRVFNIKPCKYTSRTATLFNINIFSPSTLILLFTMIFCTIRMLRNVKHHYLANGRKEMKTFFYLYLTAIIIDTILISRIISFSSEITLLITALQLSLVSTTLFCLIVGSITTLYLFSYHLLSGNVITNVLSAAYLLVVTPVIYTALLEKISELFIATVFILNAVYAICYIFFQFYTLNFLCSEIWAYGTLLISATFFILGTIPLIYGSTLIAQLTERYLDGLFFFHLFMFCSIIMMHKFWLSICESEVECTPITVKRKPR